METCWFSTTEGGESWNSYQDIVETFGSIAILSGDKTKGCSDLIQAISKRPSKETKQRQYSCTNKEDVRNGSGAGRGERVRSLELKMTPGARDAALNNELRLVCGSGYSNELIEQYWKHDSEGFEHRSSLEGGRGVVEEERSAKSRRESRKVSGTSSATDLDLIGSDIAFKKFNPVFKIKVKEPSEKRTPDVEQETPSPSVGAPSIQLATKRSKSRRKCRNALIIGLQNNTDNDDKNSSSEEVNHCPDFLRNPLSGQPFFPNYDNFKCVKYQPDFAQPLSFQEKSFNLDEECFPPLSHRQT